MLSLSVVTPGTPKKPGSNSDTKEQSTPKILKSKDSTNEDFKTPDSLSFIVNNEKKLSDSKTKDTIDASMFSTRSVKIEGLQKENDQKVESSFTKSIRRLSNPISVKRLSLILTNNNNQKSEPLIENKNDLEKKEMNRAIDKMNELKKEIQIDEHRLSFVELTKRFKTDLENGLTDTMASDLLHQNGPNALTPPKTTPEWLKLLLTMNSGFSLLLWIGATFAFIAFFTQYAQDPGTALDNVWLGIALIFVVIMTGCFQYYQEAKSSKIMETFKKMIPLQAIAIREGKKINIPVEELVVGDVVQLKSGDRIPADIRIVKSEGLKVDNSCLTGESEAQSRTPDCTDNNPLETKNLVYFSTYAVEGNATGLVIRTGDHTAVGRIANLAANLEQRETHLAQEIKHFVRIITFVAFFFGISFFIISLSLNNRVLDSIVFLIGVVVANVPEGLLACVTVCLALTAKRMAKKNCLVKHLEAVEALGSVGIICSDKTGTLTMNQMTVSHMWFDGRIVRVNMNNNGTPHVYENLTFFNEEHRSMSYSRDTDFNPHESVTWKKLMRCSILCNRSEFKGDPENMAKEINKRSCSSDASEIALLKYNETVVGNIMNFRQENQKLFEIPFNSTNKFQLSVHDTKENTNKGRLLVMKGAPERILEHCDTVLMNGVEQKITKEFRKQFETAYEALGGLGERVLGFCDYRIDYEKFPKEFKFDEYNTPINGLRLLGLISMIDPPKPNVSEAVSKCRSAGIRVFMVTGDHPITAKAIAKSVGIITEETREDVATRLNIPIEHVDPKDVKAIVVHGAQLAEMNTVELDRILRHHKEIVFARTSPQQKLLIVEGCQRLDLLVGVTGDGVNDSPAMKKADIGISMGITGSDVSKQVADMILLDDNFATIVNGIEEGRLIFDNISKIVSYTFTKNMTELTPFIMYVLFDMPLALGTITILCVDLGTDILPSLSLSYEYAERGIMSLPPRDPFKDKMTNSRMVSYCYGQIGLIEAAGGFFAYSVCLAENGFLPSRLVGIRKYWDSSDINDLQDSYGNEWTYYQRKKLEQAAQTSFFIGVVVSQIANILIHKTKRVSLFRHGMRNMHLNFAMLATLCLASFLIYTPGLNSGLGLYPIKPLWWLPAIPFAVFLLIFAESKKYISNKYPGSFIDREFNA